MGILESIGSLFSRPQVSGGASDSTNAVNRASRKPGADDRHGDFLGNFAKTLMGSPDMDLSPEQMRDRTSRRKEAGALARNAMEDPGGDFMDPPNAGGSGFGLQDVVSIIKKLF